MLELSQLSAAPSYYRHGEAGDPLCTSAEEAGVPGGTSCKAITARPNPHCVLYPPVPQEPVLKALERTLLARTLPEMVSS